MMRKFLVVEPSVVDELQLVFVVDLKGPARPLLLHRSHCIFRIAFEILLLLGLNIALALVA